MIKIIKKISYLLVLMIIGYGLVTNIIGMFSSTKTLTYSFDQKKVKELQTLKKEFEQKKTEIDSLTPGVFTTEELQTIQNDLGVILEIMNEMQLWSFKGKKTLRVQDVYKLKEESYSLSLLSITSLTKIKSNHGDQMTASLLENSLKTMSMYAKDDLDQMKQAHQGVSQLQLDTSMSYVKNYVTTINSLSDWVLKEAHAHA